METWRDVSLNKFVPRGTKIVFSWDAKVGLDKAVTKDKSVGKALFEGTQMSLDIKSPISGLVAFIQKEPIEVVEDSPAGSIVVMKVDTCKHPLVYDGVCTVCLEPNIKKHTQKIFDKISSISASDEIVKDKIDEITRGEKLILILDLDNTVIHARQVPIAFDYKGKFEGEKDSDFFEVCQSSTTKFLVKKRPLLDEFLE